ncbi:hypothetical protein FOXB_03612 [Fusarium oxysporum f. sp. conglutinans Fo5176]|uniref:Protein RER1 n=1 Tax=Fusarium oxysporum (strain Fo5176) TaxID=660025 RepID=F9FB60_FUSOF|nr:hypothetical protein FOXB_03612 [Fusarium oxysporum f. sp. conglutinans Fo5176]
MNAPEPEQTPFEAVSVHTSRLQRLCWTSRPLSSSTDGSALLSASSSSFFESFLRRAGISVGSNLQITHPDHLTYNYAVAYALGIYLLNLFLAFLQPKFDPSNEEADNEMEDGSVGTLPTKQDEEFKPFIRRLPEFKFWYWATRAIIISFFCSWFEIFNVPVFWPVLVMYWFILFFLTMRKQIQHMIKYRYVPFTVGKKNYAKNSS